MTLFKDITAMGYQKLFRKVTKEHYDINYKSFFKNTKRIKKGLAAWANTIIRLGDKQEWTHIAKYVDLDPAVKETVLWMDSVYFAKEGEKVTSKKEPLWSFKKNAPAQRYMFLRNKKGKVRKMWGGYSPKTFDGDWLKCNTEWLEENLNGSAVVADNHFMWRKKHLKKVTFHVNSAEKRCCQEDSSDSIEDSISKAKRKYSRSVEEARARVENLFGQMTTMFETLKKPWTMSDEQQNYLVATAAGIVNSRIK